MTIDSVIFNQTNGGAGAALKLDRTATNTQAICSLPTGIVSDAGSRMSFWFRLNQYPGVTDSILRLLTSGGVGVFTIDVSATGKLVLGSTVGTTILQTNTWYRISWSYTIASTAVNHFKLYLNGNVEIDKVNAGLSLTGTDSVALLVGSGSSSGGTNWATWYDDFYIDNGTDLGDPGDIRVTAKLPNSNNVNNFNTAIGNNPANRWLNVNERPLSITNGWEDTQVGGGIAENYGIESAAQGDVNISSNPIVAYMGWIWAKEGSVSGSPQITVNGVDSPITLTTSAALYYSVAASTSYPNVLPTIGMKSGTSASGTFLYEAGVQIAFLFAGSLSSSSASSPSSLSLLSSLPSSPSSSSFVSSSLSALPSQPSAAPSASPSSSSSLPSSSLVALSSGLPASSSLSSLSSSSLSSASISFSAQAGSSPQVVFASSSLSSVSSVSISVSSSLSRSVPSSSASSRTSASSISSSSGSGAVALGTVNFTGFETGDASEVELHNVASIQSNVVLNGGYSLRVNPVATQSGFANIYGIGPDGRDAQAAVALSFVRLNFLYLVKPATNDEEIFVAAYDHRAGFDKFHLRLNSAGNLAAYDAANVLLATGSRVLAPSTKYRIEAKIGTGINAPWEVRINGVVDGALSGTANLATSPNAVMRLGMSQSQNANAVDFVFDDFLWSSAAYPGPGQCQVLVPTADGSYGFGTPHGAALNWQCVDDIPPDGDTTYINQLGAGQQYTAVIGPSIFGQVNTYKSLVVARPDAGGSYAAYQIIADRDPNGNLWTDANVNIAQPGFTETIANQDRVTTILGMVDYNPGSLSSSASSISSSSKSAALASPSSAPSSRVSSSSVSLSPGSPSSLIGSSISSSSRSVSLASLSLASASPSSVSAPSPRSVSSPSFSLSSLSPSSVSAPSAPSVPPTSPASPVSISPVSRSLSSASAAPSFVLVSPSSPSSPAPSSLFSAQASSLSSPTSAAPTSSLVSRVSSASSGIASQAPSSAVSASPSSSGAPSSPAFFASSLSPSSSARPSLVSSPALFSSSSLAPSSSPKALSPVSSPSSVRSSRAAASPSSLLSSVASFAQSSLSVSSVGPISPRLGVIILDFLWFESQIVDVSWFEVPLVDVVRVWTEPDPLSFP